MTLELSTRGEAGIVAVRLVSELRPLPSLIVIVGTDSPVTLPDGTKAVRRALRLPTDPQGRVKFDGVAPGPVTVSAGSDQLLVEPQLIDVVAGQTSEVELRLVRKPPVGETLAKKRVTCNFTGSRPDEVVKYLNSAYGLSIVVDPGLAGSLGQRTISLAVTDRPVDETLRELCREIGGATFVIEGRIVFITAEKR